MRHLLGVFVVLILSAAMFAQDAELAGLVKDPAEALVPGAVLKIRNLATRLERSALSNSSGAYSVPALQPAVYQVEVSKPGFQTLVQTLKLDVGQRAQVDFTLKVGQAAESVT